MKSRLYFLIVLISSIGLALGAFYLLVKDAIFFITRKEGSARILLIEKPANYKIRLVYFNESLNKDVNAIVKLKSTYKEKVERFNTNEPIYYSGLFPKDIYIQSCRVPRKGIIAFEFVMLLLMCIAAKAGWDGIRKKCK